MRVLMPTTATTTYVLVGLESSGKTSLAAGLTGHRSRAANVAGATSAVELYDHPTCPVVDTPGLVTGADTDASRRTLATLSRTNELVVVLTVRATHLDDELATLVPLVAGRRGVVAVTHWDRVAGTAAATAALTSLEAAVGVPFVPLDARSVGSGHARLTDQLAAPGRFSPGPVTVRAGWRVEPPSTVLEHRWLGPPLGLGLLLGPPVLAVWSATVAAHRIEPLVERWLVPLTAASATLPFPFADVTAGDYGLLTMGPLLLVWALPVVLVLALVLGVLEAPLGALRLPSDVALPVAFASVRKDGLLLLSEPTLADQLDAAQLLAAVVLAGAVVPCLVTVATIARERGAQVAARLLTRQVVAVVVLAAGISWVGGLVVAR